MESLGTQTDACLLANDDPRNSEVRIFKKVLVHFTQKNLAVHKFKRVLIHSPPKNSVVHTFRIVL